MFIESKASLHDATVTNESGIYSGAWSKYGCSRINSFHEQWQQWRCVADKLFIVNCFYAALCANGMLDESVLLVGTRLLFAVFHGLCGRSGFWWRPESGTGQRTAIAIWGRRSVRLLGHGNVLAILCMLLVDHWTSDSDVSVSWTFFHALVNGYIWIKIIRLIIGPVTFTLVDCYFIVRAWRWWPWQRHVSVSLSLVGLRAWCIQHCSRCRICW